MSTEETEEKSHAERLFEQGMQHLDTRWEYYSLLATEKLAETVSSMLRFLAAGLFLLIILFFFSLGLGFWLGEKTGSDAKGFMLAGLIFVPFVVASLIWVKPLVRSRIIQSMLEEKNVQDQKGRS